MKSLKGDTKLAPGGAQKGTLKAATEGSGPAKRGWKDDEGNKLTPSEKTLRTPESGKSAAPEKKCCEFHLLMSLKGNNLLADALRLGKINVTEPCQYNYTVQRTFDGGTLKYGLCALHLSMIAEEEDCETKHTAEAGMLRQTADSSNEPLSSDEVKGRFAWLQPWEEEMSKPGTGLSAERQGWHQEWRKVKFTAAEINAFEGRQVRNMRDECFTLSVFVQSYSLDKEHAFVVIPLLRVQHKVASDVLHNDLECVRGWNSEGLMNSIRGESTYADGLSEAGVSMFLDIPELDMDARIAELESADDKEEAFEAPIATPTSTKAFLEEASKKAKNIWMQHGGKTMGDADNMGSFQSPGKPVDEKTCKPGELAAAMAQEHLGYSHGSEKTTIYSEKILGLKNNSNSENLFSAFKPVMSAFVNSPVAAYARGMKHDQNDGVKQTKAELSGSSAGASARFTSISSTVHAAILTSAYPQAESSSGPGGNGDPPPPDDGDGGGPPDDDGPPDDSGPPDDGGYQRFATVAEIGAVRRMVRVLVTDLLNNPEYQREKAAMMSEAQRLADDTLRKQADMLSALMTVAQEENARLAVEMIEAQKRLNDAQFKYKDNEEERKDDNKRFLPGSKAAVDLLRLAGEADNMLGIGLAGDPIQPIGPKLQGAALYRAITDYAYAPGTADELGVLLTPDKIWNLCGFKFGGAPDPADPHGLMKYAGASSIMDWVKRLHKDRDKSQKSYSNAVPKKEQAGFKTDAERARQHFTNIYQVKDAWDSMGKAMARVYGPRWYSVCVYCGQQLVDLYESDPEMFTLEVLKYLSDMGLAYWCGQVWLQSADTSFSISRAEAELSRAFGFLTAIAIPGMGFGLGSAFVVDNIVDPFKKDTEAGVREFLLKLPKSKKQELGVSSVPYSSLNSAGNLLGGYGIYGQLLSGLPTPDMPTGYDLGSAEQDWEITDVPVGAHWCDYDDGTYFAQLDDQEVGADGKGHRANFGKGDQLRGRGPWADRGGRGAPVRPQRTLKLSADATKLAFETLPIIVNDKNENLGVMCLRYACRNGCSSDPKHPRHRAGEMCHKVHSMEFDPSFVGFTWLHFMLALLHGGFVEAIMPKAPPSDPIALQTLADSALKMHRDKLPVPVTFLNKRVRNLGAAAPYVDIMSYFELGAEPCVVSMPLGNNSSKLMRLAGVTGVKTTDLHLLGLPKFTAKDYGGYLHQRGTDSCLLMTMGLVLDPWGWTPELYYNNAVQELNKSDVPSDKVADYQLYAEQVTGGKKIGLHALVHMGLPQHVALLVVQQIQGEWIVILYTCGQPRCVCVAYIEDQHIMPGTWGPPHEPRDWLPWSDFEPSWLTWRSLHQKHTKVTHIGTYLPILNDFMFGGEPCGTLLGGASQGSAAEDDAALSWDKILLGGGSGAGKCGYSQCEYGCFCPRPGAYFPRGSTDPIPNHANSFEVLVVPTDTGEVQVQGDEGVVPDDTASSVGVINHPNPTWRDRRAAHIDDWRDLQRQRNSPSDRRGRKRLKSGTVATSAMSLRSPGLEMAAATATSVSTSAAPATSVSTSAMSFRSRHQDHVSETESDDDDIEPDELKTKFAQTPHGFESHMTEDADAQDGFWVEADLGEAAKRVLSKEEQGLGETLAGNHKRKRELEEIAEVEVMLRTDSLQIQELQPLVNNLKIAIAELKSAFLSGEVVGEVNKMNLQKTYLKASNKLCQASVKFCNNKWWPQLFIAAFRASHPGRVDPDVDPIAMEAAFKGLVSDQVLKTIVHQATTGEEIYLTGWPESSWAPESATAKEFAREIWTSIWKDASFASSFVFGPECLPHMALAEVQGYALHRVPKRSTATGLETGAGRLIADLSHKDRRGHSINSMTDVGLYGNFKMARHADIAQSVLTLRAWFPKKRIVIAKLDVARAFRRKLLAVSAFGILGFKISGHVVLEQGEVFGHNIAPAIFAFSSEAISQAHRASGIWLTVEELEEAGYEFAEGEEKSPKFVPFFSDTYCDDGILVAPDNERFMKATKASYIGFMEANLGKEAVSMKDLEEQEFRSDKVVIGHRFVLGTKPDARGDVDFLEPTAERILKMKRLMDSEQLTPEGKHLLTAGLCMKLFSLWLWMCIPCPRLKAFIGSFKRALEGRVVTDQSVIVSPVRTGDDPTVAWQQFWSDMLTLKAVLVMHEEQLGFFRVPLFRLLSEELQLTVYPERFDTISTDASIIGGGGYCHTGVDAGCYFRILLPTHVRTDMKECMANGHDFNDTTKYTIAIVEKTLHTLGLMVFGKQGGCYVMLQDNQNVVDWVKKGWGKPLRAQVLLRRDVMHGMHKDIWSIIQYISTTRNVMADLLSRSYTEGGMDDEEVLNNFRELASELNEKLTEIVINEELIAKLFPPVVNSQDMNSLLDDVLDAARYTMTGGNETAGKLKEELKALGANHPRWVSHLDEVDGQGKHWDEVEVGGRNGRGYEPNTWGETRVNRKSVFKDEVKTVPLRNNSSRAVMVEDTEEEYEIEKVLKKRTHPLSGVVQYRIKWKDYNHRFNLWRTVEELEQGADAISDFEALVDEKGSIPCNSTDTEADRYYYAEQENSGSQTQSTSKGPCEMGGRGFGSRRFETETQLSPSKQAVASTLVAADLFKSPIYNGPSSAFMQWGKGKGKGKGGNHEHHQQWFPEECSDDHRHQNWDTRPKPNQNVGLHAFGFSGHSLADKVKAAAERKGRRIEVVITRDDDRLIQAAARTLAHSMSQNTNRTYANNFELFLGFCQRQNLSPVLNGWDKRKDEDTLIAFILYEFEIHGNKYSTLKLKLSAIRAAMMEEGYANPIEGKYTLARHMKGIKALRGNTDAKEPLPAEAFRNMLISTRGKSLKVRCTALAIAFAFFFLLRVSEFAARDSVYMEKFIALRQDVTFYKKGKLCAWNDAEADAVELFIKGSKTDQKQQGCRRMQQRSGDDILCPVKCIQEWFGLTYGSAIPANAPLFSIPKGKFGAEWKVLTRDDVTILMKGAAVECNIPSRHVATHSIRISGATALLLANVPPETVQIIGRWTSNTFIGYQRYKAELMGGIATRMANTHYITAPVYPMKKGNQ